MPLADIALYTLVDKIIGELMVVNQAAVPYGAVKYLNLFPVHFDPLINHSFSKTVSTTSCPTPMAH